MVERYNRRDIDFTPEPHEILKVLNMNGYKAKYFKSEGGWYQIDRWKQASVRVGLNLNIKYGVLHMIGGCQVEGKMVGSGFAEEYAKLESQLEKKKHLESLGEYYDMRFPRFSSFDDVVGIIEQVLGIYSDLKDELITNYRAAGLLG